MAAGFGRSAPFLRTEPEREEKTGRASGYSDPKSIG